MKKNKEMLKFLSLALIVFVSFNLVACKNEADDKMEFNSSKKIETVKVEIGEIKPTISNKTDIQKATNFIIQSNEKGNFNPIVNNGSYVKKGQIIGYVNKKEIKSPVDAKVMEIFKESNVPKNYPIFTLFYTGFSINVKKEYFLENLEDINNLKARFQVDGGIGPEDISAVVASEEDPLMLQCLISQDSEVSLGQLATVVITSKLKENVMLLPTSVIAGRVEKGMVKKVSGNKLENVEVKLGVTDGAYIEIISGLKVGDDISTLAPNLDPRDK